MGEPDAAGTRCPLAACVRHPFLKVYALTARPFHLDTPAAAANGSEAPRGGNQVQMAMEDGLPGHFAAVDAGNPARFAAEPGALQHLVRAIPAVERLPSFWSRAVSMAG
jgi:hypothetical protein